MRSKNSILISVVFFIFWLVIIYLGADHPVPNGFIFIIVIDVVLSLIVYWRSIAYFMYIANNVKRGTSKAIIEGAIVGFVLAILTLTGNLLYGKDQHFRRPIDILIWVFILLVLGSLNSVCIYGECVFFYKYYQDDKKG